MNALFLFLLLIASPLVAEGPQFRNKDTFVQQEFDNVYQDIRNMKAGANVLTSNTLAQINALVVAVGTLRYCSNCATDAVCVSTAAATNSFARLTSKTTACQ